MEKRSTSEHRRSASFTPAPKPKKAGAACLPATDSNGKELEHRVTQQLNLSRFVDARLRPAIQIDPQSIEIYYKETLVPQVRKSGSQPAPLAEVTPEIKEVLTQKKMNDLLTAWLQTLRAESQIRSAPTFPSSGGQIQ